MATIFSDDFNRADGDSLGANWTERAVDVDIVTNAAQKAGNVGSQIVACYYNGSIGSADYTVQADLLNVQSINDWFGVIGRRVNYSTDDSNMYTALFNGNTLYLYKRVSAVWTSLASAAVTRVNGEPLQLYMNGSTIRSYYSGTQRSSVTDTALSAEGNGGLGCGSASTNGHRWDDFLLEDFAAGGAMAGISNVVFSQTAALTGAGALSGTSAAVFGETGALTGSGALAGTASTVFGEAAALTGAGPLAGTAAAVFADSGTLTATGALAGAAAAVFGESATLTGLGAGAMDGVASVAFSGSAALTGTGALAGTVAAVFSETAALTGESAVQPTEAGFWTDYARLRRRRQQEEDEEIMEMISVIMPIVAEQELRL